MAIIFLVIILFYAAVIIGVPYIGTLLFVAISCFLLWIFSPAKKDGKSKDLDEGESKRDNKPQEKVTDYTLNFCGKTLQMHDIDRNGYLMELEEGRFLEEHPTWKEEKAFLLICCKCDEKQYLLCYESEKNRCVWKAIPLTVKTSDADLLSCYLSARNGGEALELHPDSISQARRILEPQDGPPFHYQHDSCVSDNMGRHDPYANEYMGYFRLDQEEIYGNLDVVDRIYLSSPPRSTTRPGDFEYYITLNLIREKGWRFGIWDSYEEFTGYYVLPDAIWQEEDIYTALDEFITCSFGGIRPNTRTTCIEKEKLENLALYMREQEELSVTEGSLF